MIYLKLSGKFRLQQGVFTVFLGCFNRVIAMLYLRVGSRFAWARLTKIDFGSNTRQRLLKGLSQA